MAGAAPFASRDGIPFRGLLDPGFLQTSFAGTLKGRFLSMGSFLLYDIDRKELVTHIQESDWAFGNMGRMLAGLDVGDRVAYKLGRAKEQSRGLPLLLTPYPNNYFHFTFECIGALRLLGDAHKAVGVRHDLAEKPFQLELLSRCLGNRAAAILNGSEIHADPILFFSYFVPECVAFVRTRMERFAAPGADTVLIERTGAATTRLDPMGQPHTASSMIAETPEWQALMQKLGARRVNFGSGELGVSQQAALLDGARTIVAAHGAAMTNIVYLRPPVNIIEIANEVWAARTQFEDISAQLGFNYRRLVCPAMDARGMMVVDTARLAEIHESMNAAG